MTSSQPSKERLIQEVHTLPDTLVGEALDFIAFIKARHQQVKDQDPEGVFIKRYLPELEAVPAEYLAEPHTMPPLVQQSIGCIVGQHYPAPIVDHHAARHRALAAFETIKA
jgi:deoxyribodipyrimidine photolyase